MRHVVISKDISFFITFLLLALFLFMLFVPMGMVYSATGDLPEFSGPIVPECGIGTGVSPFACGACDLINLSQNIVNFFVFFATAIAVLMFVYAGVLYIFALGDTGQIKKAHGIFVNVFVGFIIVLAAWLIIDLIMTTFLADGNVKGLGPWNEVLCSG